MNPKTLYLLDTSAAIPLLLTAHPAHSLVNDWAGQKELGLSGHAILETYSVLTRLPGSNRLDPHDAAELIATNFTRSVTLDHESGLNIFKILAKSGVAGGATYDGAVALAALNSGAVLVTRDARALATYSLVGVQTEVLP